MFILSSDIQNISDFLVEDSLDEEDGSGEVTGDSELSLTPIKASDCPQLDGELAKDVRNVFGESDIRDLLNAMADPNAPSKPTNNFLMNPQLCAEIQAFKALQHIPCREVISELPQGINYDTLILDCYA